MQYHRESSLTYKRKEPGRKRYKKGVIKHRKPSRRTDPSIFFFLLNLAGSILITPSAY